MQRFEIEQKFRLKNPSAMRKRLKALGAVLLTSRRQYNEYLDQNGRLRAKKCVLRLRKSGKQSFLTFKSAKIPGKFTKRLEFETPVDFDQTREIFKALGYTVLRKYAKKREEYRLKGALVTIDQLPRQLGCFLEIEGSPRQIESISKKLGLSEKDREERSYLAILFGI